MWNASVTQVPPRVPLSYKSPRFHLNRTSPCRPLISRHQQLPLRLPFTASLSLDHSNSAPRSIDFEIGKRLGDFVEIEQQVRDYELDQYGIVNNAVYLSYCEHGYYELIESIGMGVDTFTQSGYKQALRERSLKFFAPLKSRERFVIRSRFLNCTISRGHVQQFIYKLPNEELVLESNAIVVWLGKTYKPVRIPKQMKDKLVQLGLYKT